MSKLTVWNSVNVTEKIVEGNVNLQRISELKKQISHYEKQVKKINEELVRCYRDGTREISKDSNGNLVNEDGVILSDLMEVTETLNQQIPIEFQLPE